MRTKFLLGLVAFAAVAGTLLFSPAGIRPDPQSAEATSLNEIKKLLASDGQAGDEFGFYVAVDGDTAIVGAWREDAAGGSQEGAAYVFEKNQGGADNWGEVKKLVASDPEENARFGSSVGISGDTIVVGASIQSAAADNAGAAYFFERNQGGADNWGEVKKLTASDAEAGDHFGKSVAISGDTVLVGADLEDAGGTDAGAAYVFERDQGGPDNWGEVLKLTASDAENNDSFGNSVSVNGDSAIVGAWLEDVDGSTLAPGAAYVFHRDEGGADNWGEVKKLSASDFERLDRFGYSVAINGDTAVVGAWSEDSGGDQAGAAYVFERDQGGADNWGEVTKLTASDAFGGAAFGRSVAISANTAVVGAVFEGRLVGTSGGAAYVYHRDEGGADNWGEVKKLTASDRDRLDYLGQSVAVSGETTLVGASQEDALGNEAGAAYVFRVPLPKEPAADTDGDTIVDSADLDDDDDGCSDVKENGKDPKLGGLRNPHNPWDFYDVAGSPLPPQNGAPDGVVDLPNDILGVIQHHPAGTLGYDVQFDRGPWVGTNSWNETQGPDGMIDLPNDILGVILQFQHSCQ